MARMKLALIPHQDDDSLFLAYTLMRERPFVLFCTTPIIQERRGQATRRERLSEAHEAMTVLGLNYDTLQITDEELTHDNLKEALKKFPVLYSEVYAPAIEGYQKQHDIVGRVADELWDNVIHYMTYTKEDLHTKGDTVITPTGEEEELKNKMLDCYRSQSKINLPHFLAVCNLPEYYAS